MIEGVGPEDEDKGDASVLQEEVVDGEQGDLEVVGREDGEEEESGERGLDDVPLVTGGQPLPLPVLFTGARLL